MNALTKWAWKYYNLSTASAIIRKIYVNIMHFVVFNCGWVLVDFTHILQGSFIDTVSHMITQVPVK